MSFNSVVFDVAVAFWSWVCRDGVGVSMVVVSFVWTIAFKCPFVIWSLFVAHVFPSVSSVAAVLKLTLVVNRTETE